MDSKDYPRFNESTNLLVFVFCAKNENIDNIDKTLTSLKNQKYINFNAHIYLWELNKTFEDERFIFHILNNNYKIDFRNLFTSTLLNYNYNCEYFSILFSGDRIEDNYYRDLICFLQNNKEYSLCYPNDYIIFENEYIDKRIKNIIFCKKYDKFFHGVFRSNLLLSTNCVYDYELLFISALCGNIKCLKNISYKNDFTLNFHLEDVFNFGDIEDNLPQGIKNIFYIHRLFGLLNLKQNLIDKYSLYNIILNVSLKNFYGKIYNEIYFIKYFFDKLSDNKLKNNYVDLYNKYVFIKKQINYFSGKVGSLATDFVDHKDTLDLQCNSWFKTNKIQWPDNKTPRFIVTMTSYGKRLKSIVHKTIWSIMQQSVVPDGIILWLAYNDSQYIGNELRKLEQFGLRIEFCEDIRQYKKLIPSLKLFPNDILITADDDIYYPDGWFLNLKNAYLKDPNMIWAYRAKKISVDKTNSLLPYANWHLINKSTEEKFIFPTGVCGILYPPGSLNEVVLDQNLFMNLCPTSDDIWFWAMGRKNNTKHGLIFDFFDIMDYDLQYEVDEKPLSIDNMKNNDAQLKAVISKFPEIWI